MATCVELPYSEIMEKKKVFHRARIYLVLDTDVGRIPLDVQKYVCFGTAQIESSKSMTAYFIDVETGGYRLQKFQKFEAHFDLTPGSEEPVKLYIVTGKEKTLELRATVPRNKCKIYHLRPPSRRPAKRMKHTTPKGDHGVGRELLRDEF